MYESVTYENILKQMLEKVPEDIDKREGSIIYTALAPVAAELTIMYIEADWMLNQIFSDTAVREYLVKRCHEWGISPYTATRAQLKGEFNIDIALGSRFSLGTLNYVAVEKISDRVYRMECETAGSVGNKSYGAMVPVLYIAGLSRAELTAVLLEGVDEESTESLRERFLVKLRKPSTSGNKYDYYNWAMECSGVGAAKVFPLASGPGTVKVVIADSNRQAASAALVKLVSDYIERLRPVGATVLVVSATEKEIDVTASVKLTNGVNLGQAERVFSEYAGEYLKENAFNAAYVSLAKIGNLLLSVPGVEDFSDMKLNGAAGNVTLSTEEIAAVGNVKLEVM